MAIIDTSSIRPLKGDHKSCADILKHIATEVVEATVEYSRECFHDVGYNGKPEGLSSELADIVILTALLAKRLDIDLNKAIEDKMNWLEAKYAN